MKDYRVEIKVKNNYMLNAMENLGIYSASELSRKCGVDQSSIGAYLNLLSTPYNKDGKFKTNILKIAESLNSHPDSLFPPQHLNEALVTNKAYTTASEAEVKFLIAGNNQKLFDPYEEKLKEEMINNLNECLNKLTYREKTIIQKNIMEGKTLKEVGKEFGVTQASVRQTREKALRKLRHPSNSETFIDYFD